MIIAPFVLPHTVRKREVDAECALIEAALHAGGYDPTDLPIRNLADAAIVRRAVREASRLGITVVDEETRRARNGDLEVGIGLICEQDAVVLKLAIV